MNEMEILSIKTQSIVEILNLSLVKVFISDLYLERYYRGLFRDEEVISRLDDYILDC
jgi:hypothetical protein